MAFHELLQPEVISTVEGLALLSKRIVDGNMLGDNPSVKAGQGQEFRQYRSYQPGDDLRLLDWKMYARSDRYYIKEAEVETNITVRFVLDASASMLHQDDSGLQKLEYARVMAASLAYLARKQGDAIGLYALNDTKIHQLTARQEQHHFHRFLYDLLNIQGVGRFPDYSEVSLAFQRETNKEMVIVISDMYQYGHEIAQFLEEMTARKSEVILFHVMGRNELDLTYNGTLALEDLETREVVQVNTDTARKAYKQAVNEKLARLQAEMLDLQVTYQLFAMDQGIDEALSSFLKRRIKLL